MRCVAHISDLQFGAEDKAVAKGLLQDLDKQQPSLVAVSGDLTRRALAGQFSAAQCYLQRLGGRQVIIPGNRDVPVYDIFHRFAAPFHLYQKFISEDLNPDYEDSDILLLGINTARSMAWKSGRISNDQADGIRKRLRNVGKSKFKIVMTHHPFIAPRGDEASGIDPAGGAAEALKVIEAAGVDVLLAGHLHNGFSGDVRTFRPASSRSIIVAQAGKAIARSVQREPNAYNLLRLNNETIQIEVRAWVGNRFSTRAKANFQLSGTEWQIKDGGTQSDGAAWPR